jgi:hypothetical protein
VREVLPGSANGHSPSGSHLNTRSEASGASCRISGDLSILPISKTLSTI